MQYEERSGLDSESKAQRGGLFGTADLISLTQTD